MADGTRLISDEAESLQERASLGTVDMLGTPLPKDSSEAEDRIVNSLLALVAESGPILELFERPDRLDPDQRRFPDVTSDALFWRPIDGVWLALDVMSLANHAEEHVVLDRLHRKLEPIAERLKVQIRLSGTLPTREDVDPSVKAFAKAIRLTPAGGKYRSGDLVAHWGSAAVSGVEVTIIEMVGRSPHLATSVAESLREALLKKATNQAARAKGRGCLTLVVLDWLGHAGIAQGTHWLPQHPFTIAEAVRTTLAGREHSLDAVALVDRSGTWFSLYGDVGIAMNGV